MFIVETAGLVHTTLLSWIIQLLQLLIYLLLADNGVWLVSQLSQLKIYLHIMLIAMLSQVCVIIETAE